MANGWSRTTSLQNLPVFLKSITGLTDPTGHLKEVQLLQKMEQWLKGYHKDKID
jgi:hypothetical protein